MNETSLRALSETIVIDYLTTQNIAAINLLTYARTYSPFEQLKPSQKDILIYYMGQTRTAIALKAKELPFISLQGELYDKYRKQSAVLADTTEVDLLVNGTLSLVKINGYSMTVTPPQKEAWDDGLFLRLFSIAKQHYRTEAPAISQFVHLHQHTLISWDKSTC